MAEMTTRNERDGFIAANSLDGGITAKPRACENKQPHKPHIWFAGLGALACPGVAEPPAARAHSDLLGDAMTVLENVRIENPSGRIDTEDAANRVTTALGYLRMIGTHRALALVEYARQRSDRPDVIEALDELEGLVKPRV